MNSGLPEAKIAAAQPSENTGHLDKPASFHTPSTSSETAPAADQIVSGNKMVGRRSSGCRSGHQSSLGQ